VPDKQSAAIFLCLRVCVSENNNENCTQGPRIKERFFCVLADGWGIAVDEYSEFPLTRTACEWLETWESKASDDWSWQAILRLIDEGLDASDALTVILRHIWHQKQYAVRNMRMALCYAARVMKGHGVPRDVRRMIYARAGVFSLAAWHEWCPRLAALEVLWRGRHRALSLSEDAQTALLECIWQKLVAAKDADRAVAGYHKIRGILFNTRLFSRSAFLHWIIPGIRAEQETKRVQPPAFEVE